MIVVTGATGNVGRALIERLVAADRPVRALTRDPQRAGLPAGADVVRFRPPRRTRRPVRGRDRAVPVRPGRRRPHPRPPARRRHRRSAAPLLLSSGIMQEGADPSHPLHVMHATVERQVRDSGLAWTFQCVRHQRPAVGPADPRRRHRARRLRRRAVRAHPRGRHRCRRRTRPPRRRPRGRRPPPHRAGGRRQRRAGRRDRSHPWPRPALRRGAAAGGRPRALPPRTAGHAPGPPEVPGGHRRRPPEITTTVRDVTGTAARPFTVLAATCASSRCRRGRPAPSSSPTYRRACSRPS
ncbi:hypothetical protein [Streptomyces bullii]